MPGRYSISRSIRTPPSEENCPLSTRAAMALPQTGDRPGSAGVAPGLAGVVSTIGWVHV